MSEFIGSSYEIEYNIGKMEICLTPLFIDSSAFDFVDNDLFLETWQICRIYMALFLSIPPPYIHKR